MQETMTQTLERLMTDERCDSMTYTLAVTLAIATTELAERGEWDEGARLCSVLRDTDGGAGEIGLRLGQHRLPALNDGEHPIVYVRMMTEVMRGDLTGLPAVDIVAWVFVVEAWMLQTDSRDKAAVAHAHAVAGARQVHVAPDRIEARVLSMVDRAGRTYQTVTERSSGDSWLAVSGTGDDVDLSGAIPDALRELMAATPVMA